MPVSVCRALGADIVIAVNLNSDLVGRRFEAADESRSVASKGPVPEEFMMRLLEQVPQAWRGQAAQIIPRLLPVRSTAPGYFEAWPILSTLCRTKSPAHGLPVNRPISCWRRAWAKSARLNLIERRRPSRKAPRAFNKRCRTCAVISKSLRLLSSKEDGLRWNRRDSWPLLAGFAHSSVKRPRRVCQAHERSSRLAEDEHEVICWQG